MVSVPGYSDRHGQRYRALRDPGQGRPPRGGALTPAARAPTVRAAAAQDARAPAALAALLAPDTTVLTVLDNERARFSCSRSQTLAHSRSTPGMYPLTPHSMINLKLIGNDI